MSDAVHLISLPFTRVAGRRLVADAGVAGQPLCAGEPARVLQRAIAWDAPAPLCSCSRSCSSGAACRISRASPLERVGRFPATKPSLPILLLRDTDSPSPPQKSASLIPGAEADRKEKETGGKNA